MKVVLVDADRHGQRVARWCTREGAPVLQIAPFAERANGSIEDVIGTEDYLAAINSFYSHFAWFAQISLETVTQTIVTDTLGRFFDLHFEDHFQQCLNKVAVAIALTYEPQRLSGAALDRVERLIVALQNTVR